MNRSAPRATIEGSKVVPHKRRIQGRVIHPRHESGRGESVPLNETHGSIVATQGKGEPELEPANSGT